MVIRKLLSLGVICCLAASAIAQEPNTDDPPQRSELGERQRLVQRKMAQLETKFEIIAQKLETKEPERAKRLIQALQQAKEKLIAKKMEEITMLLDQQELDRAERELDSVIQNLQDLVNFVLCGY